MRLEAKIDRLGAQGDGIAETASGPVYIPFTLPGERVTAEVNGTRGAAAEIIEPSPHRTAPICRHFGECGGCALQHMEQREYLDWKRQSVENALRAEGLEAAVDPVRAIAPHSRRRATFTAVKNGSMLKFGFRRPLSHDVIDLAESPILTPPLEAAIPALRDICSGLLSSGEARVLVTACDDGLDMLIEPDGKQRAMLTPALAAAAKAAGIVRIAWRKDMLLSTGPARVTLSGVAVDLPPGAFLQAVREAEEVMAALVLDGIGKARRCADLFCGLGTFTFALARGSAVTAVESDAALLQALAAAARRASGLKPVIALRRDLMREPLSPTELKAFDAVVFDPPRAGALAQAQAIAKSQVRRVVAVSCIAATFARDARALIEGGYRLHKVTPVDQFVFSPHVEIVAVLARK